MDIWHTISQTGTDANSSWHRNRQVILCNRIAAVLSLLTFLVCSIAVTFFGFSTTVILGFTASITFLIPILLNHLQFPNGSRVFLASSLSVAAILISILDKHDFMLMEEFQYFHFRLMLLIAGLFPFVLFKLDEKKFWIPTAITNAICVIFYDNLHEYFGVGYYQVGFEGPSYYFLNYMTIATALVIGGSTYFLKYSFEETERTNENLIKNLSKANQVIYEQQKLVSEENVQLSQHLKERNIQLIEANEELIRHNSELQQFSYTISHNLRGPVASLGGLINVFNQQNEGFKNNELIEHMTKSLLSLENTIQDLSNIIDIRNNLSQIRQRINLENTLKLIKVLLEKEIAEHHVSIECDFRDCPEIYGAKHMFDSIIYNLVSNAIKYRSPDRKPLIKIQSKILNEKIVLRIQDNGLGIDIPKYKEKLFGLYKRFHTHTDGRGLGLYLVKLQTLSMGGSIDVESKLGVGTTFTVSLPIPDTLQEQILLENDFAKLYFDATLQAVGIHWKQEVATESYNEFLMKAADFVTMYHTPNWISNLSELSDRDEKKLNGLRLKISSRLKKDGLKRIAVILPRANYSDYEQRMSIMKTAYEADLKFFETLQDAKNWLVEQNQII
jgi:signal transduction histidine kinase